MLNLENLRAEVQELKENITEMGASLDVPGLQQRMEELELKMASPGFWDDPDIAQEVLKTSKNLQNKVAEYQGLEKAHDDLMTLLYFLEEGESEFEKDFVKGLEGLKKKVETIQLKTLLSGEYDHLNAIVSIHAGTGGLDAQDWAEMLYRMYTRWADASGYGLDVYDLQNDPEAGIKSVTFTVKGENAYGYMKAEKGVHRLVRLSPFDTAGKRHTSFASVDVMPELDDTVEVDIQVSDLRIDTYRSSGAGGQHVNKTDSAVRITHIPTGIVVQCQNQRSQHSNKETALKVLKGKLIELKIEENKEKIEELQGDYSQIAWGSQIRSYVFHPYSMVKDHRTNVEVGNVYGVMDGDLDPFIYGYLREQMKA
ncbi:peptide chain release factor 2 [Anoxynatronum sibiricum]|uniref:Peptide chain release factor 2 n=1 Tax=Anoxynatronum sibiricum TaxID=210623 RepID=A0ABU9VXE2_9CLOT